MIKGSTVIYNEAYIEELQRHKHNIQDKLSVEIIPDIRDSLEVQLNVVTNKLNEAIDFQEVAEELFNVDIPRIATVKTISGRVIPLANVQIL